MDLLQISMAQEAIERLNESVYDIKEELIDAGHRKTRLNEYFEDAVKRFYGDIGKINTIADTLQRSDKEYQMSRLLTNVCKSAGVTKSAFLRDRTQKRRYVTPKYVYMTFLNVMFGVSLKMAGNLFERDHTTVIHAKKTVRNLYETDRKFRIEYKSVFDFCVGYDETKFIKYLNDEN